MAHTHEVFLSGAVYERKTLTLRFKARPVRHQNWMLRVFRKTNDNELYRIQTLSILFPEVVPPPLLGTDMAACVRSSARTPPLRTHTAVGGICDNVLNKAHSA